MSKYAARLARGQRQWLDLFDPSELDAVHESVRRHFETGNRVEVVTTYGSGETYVRRGRISTTTGWRPSFILMHRVSDIGSGDVLGPNARVTAVISR